jgi:hypothetical protein
MQSHLQRLKGEPATSLHEQFAVDDEALGL